MKIKTVLLAIALLVPTLGWTQALRTPEQIQAAKDWSFQGIKLGTSLTTVRQLWPGLKKDKNAGTTDVYLSLTPNKGADGLQVTFVADRLVDMRIYYSADRLSKIGGIGTLAGRLRDLFGPADSNSPGSKTGNASVWGELWWTFQGSPITFTLRQMKTISMIQVSTTSATDRAAAAGF